MSFLLDLLMPKRCAFCGALWAPNLPCPSCQRELPWLIEGEAEMPVEFISLTVAPLRYQGGVRQAIHRLKFRRRLGCVNTLAPLMTSCIRDHLEGRFDLVTWVPLSPKGLRQRGFDQARLLAEAAVKPLGYVPVSLFAKRNGVARQSTIQDVFQRKANVLGAYTLLHPEKVRGRRVLIVDDVVTSGSTLSECACLLRLAGCEDVVAVTAAQAKGAKHV